MTLEAPKTNPLAQLQEEVEKEINDEIIKEAKERLKKKRREIEQAKRILANLKLEYDALLLEIDRDLVR